MTIADELAALPKMPDVTPDEQYLWDVISFFETRLALAERCLKDCACPEKRRDKSMREIEDDARAYLAHRTKEKT